MYATLDFVKKVLRDDFLIYPTDMDPYFDFAQAEIDARLAGTFLVPFDDLTNYSAVPSLIQWITSYLVGYKLYDEMTSLENIENSTGDKWWAMAQAWLTGLVDGTYLLHLPDGTVVDGLGTSSGPRYYPSGVRAKASSAENIPYFTRDKAWEW